MRIAARLVIAITTCLGYTFTAYAQVPDFTGTWVVNFEKSKLEDKPEDMTGNIFKIKQQGEKFKIKIYHLSGEKKRKIGFKMKADGKTRPVKLIFKGKLEKTADGLKASIWRKDFENVVNYRLGQTNDELVADEVFKGKPRDHHSIWVFDREK
jgi:hypothetical protein